MVKGFIIGHPDFPPATAKVPPGTVVEMEFLVTDDEARILHGAR